MNKIAVLVMMRKLLYGVFLFFLVATTVADEEVKSIKTPLLGITAVSDEESEVVEPESAAGGAMEMSRYFATHLQSELVFCGNTVSAIFDVWLASNKIIPTERTIKADSMFIRAWDKAQEGIFEARYLASNQPAYVRVSLDYYAISGQLLPIELTQSIIKIYELSSLWESLAEAIECDS